MIADIADVRRACNALIDAWRRVGAEARAQEVARLAVEQGIWLRPEQRPIHFLPQLAAKAVHDPASFYLVRYLEAHADAIADEALGQLGNGGLGLMPVEEPLVATGGWDIAMFYEGGMRFDATCERFPGIARLIDDGPEEIREAGVVMLSWLHPGTYIVPHCGFSNARLRVHLPLRTAAGATMRVAGQSLEWERGRCLVFDDSFEHEVHHDGSEPRLVLLVDMFHPGLGAASREEFVQQFGINPERKAREWMGSLGLQSIALAEADTFNVRFAPEQERSIHRHLRECGLPALDVAAIGLPPARRKPV